MTTDTMTNNYILFNRYTVFHRDLYLNFDGCIQNTWCHICMVRDTTDLQFKTYINGEYKVQLTTTNSIE